MVLPFTVSQLGAPPYSMNLCKSLQETLKRNGGISSPFLIPYSVAPRFVRPLALSFSFLFALGYVPERALFCKLPKWAASESGLSELDFKQVIPCSRKRVATVRALPNNFARHRASFGFCIFFWPGVQRPQPRFFMFFLARFWTRRSSHCSA